MYHPFGPSESPSNPGIALNGADDQTDERLDFSGANMDVTSHRRTYA
jgi:hypothetical protein